MENKGLWAGLLGCVIALAALVLAATKLVQPVSPVVVTTGGGQQSAPYAVSPVVVQAGNGSSGGVVTNSVPVAPQRFGGTTGLDSLTLQNDLTVGGNSTFTGTSAFTGATTLSGALTLGSTLSLAGDVLSALPGAVSSTMTAATSTCSVQNTSGRTRVLFSVGAVVASTTSAGSVNFLVGTSTVSGVSSTSPLINATITSITGRDVVLPTSTLGALNLNTSSTIYNVAWQNNEWLNWKVGTSTMSGVCRAAYY